MCVGAALVGIGGYASAQATKEPCGSVRQEDDVLSTPAVGASGVRLDAPVVLRYREPVILDELREPIQLFRRTDEGLLVSVAGALQQIDAHTLHFQPVERFEPTAEYVGDAAWPGGGTGSDAPRFDLRFRTGDDVDREAPTLDFPGDDLELSSGGVSPQCDAEEGSFLVSVIFDQAQDDGSAGSIEYFLYLTRSEGIDHPVLKQRVRNFNERITMSFVLGPDEVVAPVCVSVVAVDGVGRKSEAGEHCFDPVRGSYFAPCAVSGAVSRGRGAAGARAGHPSGWMMGLALLGLWMRRRRALLTPRT